MSAKRSFDVVHFAYCGMQIPLAQDVDFAAARARFERRIAHFKKTYGGAVLRSGLSRAELCEPETAMMVPDACGVLRIVGHGEWSA